MAWLAVSLGLALGQGAIGQSLDDAARREKERRAKAARSPARSYTDADLASRDGTKAAQPSPSPSPSPSGPASGPSASPSPGPDERALRREKELEWRERFANARARVATAEAAAWRTVVEVVYVSGIPVQQQVRRFEETDDLRAARRALSDLEEEFRRTGLPPGWTRD